MRPPCAYRLFPSNPVISVDYAKALLNNKKSKECIDVLNKTLILPQEGAKEGHELFELANIALALDYMELKKYKAATKYLVNSKQYPEKLGEGKPYNADYRLQDYLLAYCAKQIKDEKTASQCYQNIIDFSSDPDRFNSPRNAATNYLSLLVLNKQGHKNQADELLKGWQHCRDSLSVWHISNIDESTQMQWVLTKIKDPLADTKVLEQKVTGSGPISNFTLFLRALDLVEEKRRLNQ